MNWDGYTIFSVLTGIVLIACALFVRAQSIWGRIWFAVGGIASAAYGLYVASQTTGTYYFSVWIFVIPLGAIAYAFVPRLRASQQAHGQAVRQRLHRPASGVGLLETTMPAPAQGTPTPRPEFRREAGESLDHAVWRLLRHYWAPFQVGEPFGPGLGLERAVEKVSRVFLVEPRELNRISAEQLTSLMEEVHAGRVTYDDWEDVLGLRWSAYRNRYLSRRQFQAVSRSVETLRDLGAHRAQGHGALLDRWVADADFQCEVLAWALIIHCRLRETGKIAPVPQADALLLPAAP